MLQEILAPDTATLLAAAASWQWRREGTARCLPREQTSGTGRGNHWSQEAAPQTGLLPGRLWQGRARLFPGLFLALWGWGCACSVAPEDPG